MGNEDKVRNAMLAVQRFSWEQGTCMQALYEWGDELTAYAMAHDAVKRQASDGRLAISDGGSNVTDPASNGEVVYRAFQKYGDPFYGDAAEAQLTYLMEKAPRTENGTLSHIWKTGDPQASPLQIWVDSIYMAPPFLAVMGEVEEAWKQIQGMMGYLMDPEKGVLFHIYDAGQHKFIRQKRWATGNGWALLGMGRVLEEAKKQGREDLAEEIRQELTKLLDRVLSYQLPNGLFHDILDEPESFEDGAAAMMTAALIYRGLFHGYLPVSYKVNADLVAEEMESHVDELGMIHGVCGCPHFVEEGTSAESMAAYLMMHAWKKKVEKDCKKDKNKV